MTPFGPPDAVAKAFRRIVESWGIPLSGDP